MKRLASFVKLIILSCLLITLTSGCGNTAQTEKTPASQGAKQALFAYVGAGLKEPVSEIARLYQQKTGVKVDMTFNNTGALLTQMVTSKKGDIYVPGGMTDLDKAKQKGCIAETVSPLAYHTPVILVPKGNPAHITKVQDLANPGIKLIMPDQKATALGQSAAKTFDQLGITAQVEKNILTTVETGPKVLTTLLMKQGNAAIGEYAQYYANKDKVDMVPIDPAVNHPEEVPAALLTYSNQKDQAKDFLKFMKEEGPAVFAKYGFKEKI